MITTDYHVHTKFSSDSFEEMENSVKAAINIGLTGIAFTEHMDLDFPEKLKKTMLEEYGDSVYVSHPDFDKRPLFTFDIPAYLKKVGEMREKYGDRIDIRTGFEAGMKPGRADLTAQYTSMKADYGFQIVLGSMHLIDDEDPYFESVWDGHSADYTVSKYFNDLAQCVAENSFFDSLAHIDYVVRYVPEKLLTRPLPEYFQQVPDKNKEPIDFILKTIISRGQALEINTKGNYRGIKHSHPADSILTRYRELGGTLFTYGSDAHEASSVGRGIIS